MGRCKSCHWKSRRQVVGIMSNTFDILKVLDLCIFNVSPLLFARFPPLVLSRMYQHLVYTKEEYLENTNVANYQVWGP